jgi:hypothetical protein
MITGVDAVLKVVEILQTLNVPYMLVGSFSSNFYGVARATRDADLLVALTPDSRKALLAKLPAEIKPEPQAAFETVTGTLRQILDVPALPFKIELFDLGSDAHDQERFRRRTHVLTMGREVFLPTPEDVIIQKLRWSAGAKRSKDYDDAVSVIAVQCEVLDWPYIREWCAKHKTLELLERARRDATPASGQGRGP